MIITDADVIAGLRIPEARFPRLVDATEIDLSFAHPSLVNPLVQLLFLKLPTRGTPRARHQVTRDTMHQTTRQKQTTRQHQTTKQVP